MKLANFELPVSIQSHRRDACMFFTNIKHALSRALSRFATGPQREGQAAKVPEIFYCIFDGSTKFIIVNLIFEFQKTKN